MNVLVLSNCAPDPNTGSGAVVDLVLRELAATGAAAEFFYLQPRGILGRARASRYLGLFRALVQGRRRVRAKAFDLVICFGGEWALFTAWAARQVRAWRLLQYSNGVESHAAAALRQAQRTSGSLRPRWFQRGDLSRVHDWAFVHADHVAVVSDFDARYLRDVLALPPDKVSVLYTPLPPYFLARQRPAPRPARLGYCGSWHPRKNVSLILRDVSRFLRAFPGWQFEAVGPGTEELQNACDAAVSARMRGRGRMPREQLPEWYSGCSIVMLPSVYESFGLAAAEAMACGCAVIGSAGSAFVASLRHGEQVYLLESLQSPALERALTVLARDAVLRERISAGGYDRVQELTLDGWRSVFRGVVGRPWN